MGMLDRGVVGEEEGGESLEELVEEGWGLVFGRGGMGGCGGAFS